MGRVERLFVLLGLSPGVLHTVLCAWRRRGLIGDDTRVILLATRRDAAEKAVEVAARCPCPGEERAPLRDPGLVEVRLLERGDYDSVGAVRELRSVLVELGVGPGDGVDVTGGRKLASVEVALFAAQRGALVGYSLIPSSEYQRLQGRGEEGDVCESMTSRIPPELIAPLP